MTIPLRVLPGGILLVLALCCLPVLGQPPGAAAEPSSGWPAVLLERFPELRWLHPGADPVQALSSSPTECLFPPTEQEALFVVETGRQLFRAAILLDDSRQERGLSCQTCHPGGRAAQQFHAQGLRDAAGRVDARDAWFGAIMEGGRKRTAPIPDLLDAWRRAGPGDELHELPPQSLVRAKLLLFKTAQPDAVLAPLAAYLEALSASACPLEETQPLRLDDQLMEILRAVSTLHGSFEVNSGLGQWLQTAADAQLASLWQRFALPGLEDLADGIDERRTALRLAAYRVDVDAAFRDWLTDWRAFIPALREREQDSLYDRERLDAWVRIQLTKVGNTMPASRNRGAALVK